jgi:hypothetical protein
VILEHLVLGLHTCLVPVFLSFPLLLCIPCLGSAPQYTPLCLLSAFIYLVCITSTSIPASLRCTCFDIARQISSSLSTFRANPITIQVGHYGQPTVTESVPTTSPCDSCAPGVLTVTMKIPKSIEGGGLSVCPDVTRGRRGTYSENGCAVQAGVDLADVFFASFAHCLYSCW